MGIRENKLTATDPIRATDVRHHNIRAVLNSIYASRNSGGASQSDIVNRLGLKAPSVFRIFNHLEENGYIVPCEQTMNFSNKLGRHPNMYTVNPSALYIIGVEYWSACLSIGVFDFTRQRIYSHLEYLEEGIDAEFIVNRICEVVREAIAKCNLPGDKIIGLGVAAPGKVNVSTGRIVFYSEIRGMVDFPLKTRLEEMLGLKVLVHNNCNAMAYSVYHYGNKNSGKDVDWMERPYFPANQRRVKI